VGKGKVGHAVWSWAAGGIRPGGQRRRREGGEEQQARPMGQKPGKEGETLFFFYFPIFQSYFPKYFEFSFVFEVNYSVQKFQCSSMSAQSCI
jgi:hypothetical protein